MLYMHDIIELNSIKRKLFSRQRSMNNTLINLTLTTCFYFLDVPNVSVTKECKKLFSYLIHWYLSSFRTHNTKNNQRKKTWEKIKHGEMTRDSRSGATCEIKADSAVPASPAFVLRQHLQASRHTRCCARVRELNVSRLERPDGI